MAEQKTEQTAMDVEDTIPQDEEFVNRLETIDESTSSPQQKAADYLALLQSTRSDESATKIKEQCIYRLAKIFTENKQFDEVANLLKGNSDFFGAIPKARTAKIVRNMLNIVATVPDSLTIQVDLCQDVIAWCKLEKRTFLRQRIEAKLAALYLQKGEPVRAMGLIDELLTELRRLDDKQMLTEVHLTESRVYHALQNIPKCKVYATRWEDVVV